MDDMFEVEIGAPFTPARDRWQEFDWYKCTWDIAASFWSHDSSDRGHYLAMIDFPSDLHWMPNGKAE